MGKGKDCMLETISPQKQLIAIATPIISALVSAVVAAVVAAVAAVGMPNHPVAIVLNCSRK